MRSSVTNIESATTIGKYEIWRSIQTFKFLNQFLLTTMQDTNFDRSDFNTCIAYFRRGQFNDGIDYFESKVDHNFITLYNMGGLLAIFNEHGKATKYYIRALYADLDNFHEFYSKTHPSHNMDIPSAIMCHIHSWPQIDSIYPELFGSLGLVFFNQDMLEESIRWNNLSTLFYSNNLKPYLYNGISFCKLEKYKAAIAFFDRGLEIQPNNFYAHLYKSYAVYKSGSWLDAAKSCEAALKVESNNPIASEFREYVLSTDTSKNMPIALQTLFSYTPRRLKDISI